MTRIKMDTGTWHTPDCSYVHEHGRVMKEREVLPRTVDPEAVCKHCLRGRYRELSDG